MIKRQEKIMEFKLKDWLFYPKPKDNENLETSYTIRFTFSENGLSYRQKDLNIWNYFALPKVVWMETDSLTRTSERFNKEIVIKSR